MVTSLHTSTLLISSSRSHRKGIPYRPYSLGGAPGVGRSQKRKGPVCRFRGSPRRSCHLLHPQLSEEQRTSSVGAVHAAGRPEQQ